MMAAIRYNQVKFLEDDIPVRLFTNEMYLGALIKTVNQAIQPIFNNLLHNEIDIPVIIDDILRGYPKPKKIYVIVLRDSNYEDARWISRITEVDYFDGRSTTSPRFSPKVVVDGSETIACRCMTTKLKNYEMVVERIIETRGRFIILHFLPTCNDFNYNKREVFTPIFKNIFIMKSVVKATLMGNSTLSAEFTKMVMNESIPPRDKNFTLVDLQNWIKRLGVSSDTLITDLVNIGKKYADLDEDLRFMSNYQPGHLGAGEFNVATVDIFLFQEVGKILRKLGFLERYHFDTTFKGFRFGFASPLSIALGLTKNPEKSKSYGLMCSCLFSRFITTDSYEFYFLFMKSALKKRGLSIDFLISDGADEIKNAFNEHFRRMCITCFGHLFENIKDYAKIIGKGDQILKLFGEMREGVKEFIKKKDGKGLVDFYLSKLMPFLEKCKPGSGEKAQKRLNELIEMIRVQLHCQGPGIVIDNNLAEAINKSYKRGLEIIAMALSFHEGVEYSYTKYLYFRDQIFRLRCDLPCEIKMDKKLRKKILYFDYVRARQEYQDLEAGEGSLGRKLSLQKKYSLKENSSYMNRLLLSSLNAGLLIDQRLSQLSVNIALSFPLDTSLCFDEDLNHEKLESMAVKIINNRSFLQLVGRSGSNAVTFIFDCKPLFTYIGKKTYFCMGCETFAMFHICQHVLVACEFSNQWNVVHSVFKKYNKSKETFKDGFRVLTTSFSQRINSGAKIGNPFRNRGQGELELLLKEVPPHLKTVKDPVSGILLPLEKKFLSAMIVEKLKKIALSFVLSYDPSSGKKKALPSRKDHLIDFILIEGLERAYTKYVNEVGGEAEMNIRSMGRPNSLIGRREKLVPQTRSTTRRRKTRHNN